MKQRKPPPHWIIYISKGNELLGEIAADSIDEALDRAAKRWRKRDDLNALYKPGVEALQRKNERKVDRDPAPFAYHESGHAVMALQVGVGVERVTIRPRVCSEGGRFHPEADSLGVTQFKPIGKSVRLYDSSHRAEAEARMMIAMAGPMAEFKYRGRNNWKRVTGIDARSLMGFAMVHGGGMGECPARYVDWIKARTSYWLGVTWPQVVALADALIERRELSGEEILELRRLGPAAVDPTFGNQITREIPEPS